MSPSDLAIALFSGGHKVLALDPSTLTPIAPGLKELSSEGMVQALWRMRPNAVPAVAREDGTFDADPIHLLEPSTPSAPEPEPAPELTPEQNDTLAGEFAKMRAEAAPVALRLIDDGPRSPEPPPLADSERPAAPGAIDPAAYLMPGRRTIEEIRAATASEAESLDTIAPTLGASLAPAFGMARRRATGEERPAPLPWPSIAELMGGGFWPGAYVLVGGTGIGKSALALQVGLHGARTGCPVLYEGLELDTAQIVMRLASQAMGETEPRPVPWGALYRGQDPGAIDRAEKLCEAELARLPFRIEEAPPGGWSASALFGRVRALKEAHPEATGTPLVVVDFLQLVGSEPGTRREELRERIGRASYTGREVARKLGAVVLMLSSISREGARLISTLAEQGELGRCDPADLVGLGKESGDIEFSADAVLTLAPEKWDPSDRSAPRPVHVAIGKQRAGPAAWGLLAFNGAWFSEAGRAIEVALEERQIAARAGKTAAKEAARAEKQGRERAEAKELVVAELRKARKPLSMRELRNRIHRRGQLVDAARADAESEGLVREEAGKWVLA